METQLLNWKPDTNVVLLGGKSLGLVSFCTTQVAALPVPGTRYTCNMEYRIDIEYIPKYIFSLMPIMLLFLLTNKSSKYYILFRCISTGLGTELVRAEAQLGVDDLLINAQSRGRNQTRADYRVSEVITPRQPRCCLWRWVKLFVINTSLNQFYWL